MKAFGPIVCITEGTNDLQVKCFTKTHYCIFLVGHMCTHQRHQQQIPDMKETPDFCCMKASSIRDARELMDFDRMGLTDMRRPELQREAKRIGATCPKPLSKANAYMLRKAIREARLATEAAASWKT